MANKNHSVKIKYGTRISNLHDIGYLSTDINQIVTFANLFEDSRDEKIEQFFGERAKGFNRYT